MPKKLLLSHTVNLSSLADPELLWLPSQENILVALKFVILNRNMFLPYISEIKTLSEDREGTHYVLEVIFTPTIKMTETVDFLGQGVVFNLPGSKDYPPFEYSIKLQQSNTSEFLLSFYYYQIFKGSIDLKQSYAFSANPEHFSLTKQAWLMKDQELAKAVVDTVQEDLAARHN